MGVGTAPDAFAEATRVVLDRVRERGGSPTIYDIAELAGVNPSTVSRALGKPGRISAKTAARVQQAADALGFRVNTAARALQTGRTRMLGLVVADITNPVVFDIIRGAEHEASAAGYTLVIAESQESGENEAEAIDRLLPSVDGLVLATTRLSTRDITAAAQRKPVVLVNRALDGIDGVLPDLDAGIGELLDHLVGLGHRQIAFLAGPATSWMSENRWMTVLAAAEARDAGIVRIGPNPPTIEGGRRTLRLVRAARATAAIAFNDLMAIGLMQEAAARGLAVPAELSVAGFDDIFGSELITPPLTTVRTDLQLAGRRAVAALLRTVDGGEQREVAAASALLPTHLVVRGSTARPLG